jgi:acetyl esterase
MYLTYVEAANAQKKTGANPADPLTVPIDVARKQQDRYFQSLNQDLPEIFQSFDEEVAGPQGNIPIRMSYPNAKIDLPCIIFIRGAGFWAGNLDSHARTMRSLAILSSCAVCAVDYHRAPEYRFPTQRDEVIAVIQWLQKEQSRLRIQGQQFVLFGESAGATIALSVALTLRDQKDQSIAGLSLFYCNAGGPKPTARAYSQWVWEQYLGHSGPSTDNNAVPLLNSFKDMPPAWIGVGESDPLIEDSQDLYKKLSEYSNQVSIKTYPDLPHAFVMFSGSLLPAYEALKEAANISQHFLTKNH